jgi:hypothetical protein
MVKKLTFIFLCITGSHIYAQKENATLILHLKNADPSYYAYAACKYGDLFFDSVANDVDTFSFYIPEPVLILFLVKNDTSKRFAYYLDIGKNEVYVDMADVRHPVFINSPINDELVQMRHTEDSIERTVFTPETIQTLKNAGPFSAFSDSVQKLIDKKIDELDRQKYLEAFHNTNSFLTLSFISFQLEILHYRKENAL